MDMSFRVWLEADDGRDPAMNIHGRVQTGDAELDHLSDAAATSEMLGRKPSYPVPPRFAGLKPTDMEAMMVELMDLDTKIAEKIDSHGLSKGSLSAQLAILVQKLTKGIQGVHSAPLAFTPEKALAASGFGSPGGSYKDGGFIICGMPGVPLAKKIGFVIVSQPFAENGIVDGVALLSKKFPGVKFVSYKQACGFVAKLGSQTTAAPAASGQAGQLSITDLLVKAGVPREHIAADPSRDGQHVLVRNRAKNGRGVLVPIKLDQASKARVNAELAALFDLG